MRAITLKQPWATLLMAGLKHHETRSWRLPLDLLNFPILIHAGKAYDDDYSDMIHGHVMACAADKERAIRGAILGAVTFNACLQVDCNGRFPTSISVYQLSFGDYAPGRWYWTVGERRVFKEPIPDVRGKLGIWTYQGDLP